ncbi:MAG: GNAT family N-acetyltransferase [Atopobiaceae bacterium]|jgi:ribosomal protein S18 acetylase RimI-like enzyme|nr:GNAT family N-acetyltransferase [Atopobiaceae bacterium]
MEIRRAREDDIPRLGELLVQVAAVHHAGRPDLFRAGARKYSDDELAGMLGDESRPIFVAVDEQGVVAGYAFCVSQRHERDHVLADVRTLYVDDLCVDARLRGSGVGTALYEHVLGYAREGGYHNVTLNVWSCNPAALRFYEARGLTPQKVGMEQVL